MEVSFLSFPPSFTTTAAVKLVVVVVVVVACLFDMETELVFLLVFCFLLG